jgi:hypothetical protein
VQTVGGTKVAIFYSPWGSGGEELAAYAERFNVMGGVTIDQGFGVSVDRRKHLFALIVPLLLREWDEGAR